MSTVNDIVEKALRKCRIRDTTDTTRMAEGLAAFNDMIKSWEEIYHFAVTRESFTLTVGTESYTIGSGGDFDTIRPSMIKSAFIRDSDGYDHDVEIQAEKNYSDIYDKDESGRPTKLYYNAANPLGTIYLNSAPSSAETLYLISYKPFSVYSALTDTLLEPVEYEKAFIYNLAVDLAPEYGVTLDQVTIQQAVILKNWVGVRSSFPIPEASFDNALLR